jgi:hypothetical protein
MAPGDLHGGCFHTLGPVYALFYGGLIQPIQIALGVKRIDNNKVEKTYEQARILVVRILKEGERLERIAQLSSQCHMETFLWKDKECEDFLQVA